MLNFGCFKNPSNYGQNNLFIAEDGNELSSRLKEDGNYNIWKKKTFSLINNHTKDGIKQSSLVIFLLSNNYHKTDHFEKRLNLAQKYSKKTLAIQINGQLISTKFDNILYIDNLNESFAKITRKINELLYSTCVYISCIKYEAQYLYFYENFKRNLQLSHSIDSTLLNNLDVSYNLQSNGHIQHCQVFICCLTREYIKTYQFKNELKLANDLKKKIIFIQFEQLDNLERILALNKDYELVDANVDRFKEFIGSEYKKLLKAIRDGQSLKQLKLNFDKVIKELSEIEFGKKKRVTFKSPYRQVLIKVDENNNEIKSNELANQVCGYKEILYRPQHRDDIFVSIQVSYDKKKLYFLKYKDCQSHYDISVVSVSSDMSNLKYPHLEHTLVTRSVPTGMTINTNNEILVNTSDGFLLNLNTSKCYGASSQSNEEVGMLGLDSKSFYDPWSNRLFVASYYENKIHVFNDTNNDYTQLRIDNPANLFITKESLYILSLTNRVYEHSVIDRYPNNDRINEEAFIYVIDKQNFDLKNRINCSLFSYEPRGLYIDDDDLSRIFTIGYDLIAPSDKSNACQYLFIISSISSSLLNKISLNRDGIFDFSLLSFNKILVLRKDFNPLMINFK